MDGMLSGLAGLGLGNLENSDIFENPEEKKDAEQPKTPEMLEQDLIYEKSNVCPVCDRKFQAKIMKTGKAKLLKTDRDLRPKYEAIDAQKYDVILCPSCGYAALTRFFPHIRDTQIKLIKEQISKVVRLRAYNGEIYTYEEALERYKLALANAVVKKAKNSEKAYICLKTAWLLRGYRESLEEEGAEADKIKAAESAEQLHLKNAYKGFTEALKSEGFPMCGMDETTINYLLAVLAMETGEYESASRILAKILTDTSVNARIKDKARELKEEILEGLKKAK